MNSILSVAALGHCSAKPTLSGSVMGLNTSMTHAGKYEKDKKEAEKKKSEKELPVPSSPEKNKPSEAPKKLQEPPKRVKVSDFISAHLK